MGVKSILAFLLRLGHTLHWSGGGDIFLTERETRLKKNRLISTLRMKKTHIVLEKEGGVADFQ